MPWEIVGYDERNNRIDIRSFIPQGRAENFRTRDVYAAIQDGLKLDGDAYPLHLMRNEVEQSEARRGLPWSDPIHTWGGLINDDPSRDSSNGSIRFENQGLIWMGPHDQSCRVAHAQTFAVFAVTPEVDHVEIVWRPEPFELPGGFADWSAAGRNAPGRVFFDLRGYFGRHSSILDGFRRTVRGLWDKSYRAVLKLKRGVGYVVVKACLHVGGVGTAMRTDPSQAPRLARLTAEHPQHARRIPELTGRESVRARSAVVHVHGTVSSGIVGVASFDIARIPGDAEWYRFEHDTFLAIDANATELAAKIANGLHAERLLLIGHSRGGLVARAAAAELGDREVHVWTFGTPHFGTPVIKAAEGARQVIATTSEFGLGALKVPEWAMALVLRMGCKVASAIPLPDVQTAAWSFFLADRELPVGFSDMEEGSSWLRAANRYDPVSRRSASADLLAAQKTNGQWPAPAGKDDGWHIGSNHLRMYAGTFDGNTSKRSGYSVMTGSAEGLFGPQPNDLVVSVQSATLAKNHRVLPDCTHFDYFDDASVQGDILGF
jgi:hypothetical protein